MILAKRSFVGGAIRIQKYCGKSCWCCAAAVPAEPVFMHKNLDHLIQIPVFAVSGGHLFSISNTIGNWYLRSEYDSLCMSISQKSVPILVSTHSTFHSAACALNAFFPCVTMTSKRQFCYSMLPNKQTKLKQNIKLLSSSDLFSGFCT